MLSGVGQLTEVTDSVPRNFQIRREFAVSFDFMEQRSMGILK